MTGLKVTMLCSSLEAGRDGVGDYTRLMAGELANRGHRCQAISLNDPHVEFESEQGAGMIALRLSSRMPWRQREDAAAKAIARFDPDWISLQFVAYGFHAKGLPVGLRVRLRRLAGRRKLHLMLHELWIGEAADYGLKERAAGWLQKKLILRMVRTLRPAAMHTSNPVYAAMLAEQGYQPGELPLFGNVAVDSDPSAAWVYNRLSDSGIVIDPSNRAGLFIAGIFGTIHPQWSPKSLLRSLELLAQERGQRLLFVAFGRIGLPGEQMWKILAHDGSDGTAFLNLGEQPSPRISQILQNLDLGVSASPWALAGKSGTIAAMLDHGLPVVVGRDDWHRRRGPTPPPTPHPLLFREDEFLEAARAGKLCRRAPSPALPAVASQMLNDLTRASKPAR